MDDIRAKALKEREELRERLAELDAFLAVYDRLSRTETERTKLTDPPKTVHETEQSPARKVANRPDSIAEAAETVIRELGKPMTRGEIVAALAERGILIIAADKARYLGTILWRKPQFVNVEGSGYWLKDLPLPPNPQRLVFE